MTAFVEFYGYKETKNHTTGGGLFGFSERFN